MLVEIGLFVLFIHSPLYINLPEWIVLSFDILFWIVGIAGLTLLSIRVLRMLRSPASEEAQHDLMEIPASSEEIFDRELELDKPSIGGGAIEFSARA